MKLTQIITAGLVGTFVLIGSATAQNAFNDAEKAVEYRQKALSVMQNNFAAMGDMVKGEVDWDSAVFAARAADFAAMSGIPWSGFETSGAQPGSNTDALPAIWENWSDFQERAEQLESDAATLLTAAQGGDEAAMKRTFMAAARNCKGCHDQYKD